MQVPKVAATALTGDTLWCGLWGFLTLFFFVVTLRKNGCMQTIFASLFVTFFLLCGANYSEKCKQAAGYVGFFCGSSAIYAAIAMLYQVRTTQRLPNRWRRRRRCAAAGLLGCSGSLRGGGGERCGLA